MAHTKLVPFLVSGALAAAGCATSPAVTAVSPISSGARPITLDVAEAVFRYQFTQGGGIAATYCIGFGRGSTLGDPPPELVARLAGPSLVVKAASACGFGDRAFDKANRADAVIFYVDTMTCAGPRRCTVQGGYLVGNMSASANRYELRRTGGRWRVASDMIEAVS